MANQRRPGGPVRGNAPLPKKTKAPFVDNKVASESAKTTTIKGLQNHNLTYRSKKIKITLWKPNLPNNEDYD